MKLSDQTCKSAKPKDKAYKLSDGGGLYLEVTKTGSTLWRLKYRFLKKERKLCIGEYPVITLAEARSHRDKAKNLIANNVDPSALKQEQKKDRELEYRNTFETIAREWCEYKKTDWSEANAQTTLKRLEKDVFPAIGSVPIKMITHKMLLELAQNIKARGANELAKRVIQMSKHIFQYAIITGRADKNIGQDLVGIVKSEPKGHFASIDSKDIPQFDVGNDFVQKAQRTTYFKKLAPVLLFNLAVAGPAIAHYEEKLLDENGFDSSHMTFYRK